MATTVEWSFIDQDNSSHWYVVPVVNRAEWDAWCALPDDDERSWEPPDFAVSIDGPHRLVFGAYELA